MNRPLIIDDRLHAPYFTFIKEEGKLSVTKLLQTLEIEGYKSTEYVEDFNHYFFIVRDGKWTHIIDDWYYTLWHSKPFLSNIRKLASNYEIFSFMIGDSDNSFEIEYHRGGQMMRHFIFDQSPFGNGEVKEDLGKKFEIESKIKIGDDPLNHLWSIADSLGINSNHKQDEIDIFTKPYKRHDASNKRQGASKSCWWHRFIMKE
ncbi:MAG: hypothetical protein Q3M30_00310 [Candidatus Electrothrix sp. Rat3]|nr:hypothetical protein [Candidatus Electrothrix rattekaaiensis]